MGTKYTQDQSVYANCSSKKEHRQKKFGSTLFFVVGILFFVVIISFLGFNTATGQSGLCTSNTPFYTVNLTGNPGGSWTSPSIARNGQCCGTLAPDRCIEFQITLDPNSAGLIFSIASGAIPPGALYYQVGCGPQTPVGSVICLTTPGPHTLTFCKPGNNNNTYRITSVPRASAPDAIYTSHACPGSITAQGLTTSTITWTDITSGTGVYNSYLSCTSGCSTVTVTPQAGHPPFVDYQVCGDVLAAGCYFSIDWCDTVRVYMLDDLTATVSPNPASFCSADGGITLSGHAAGGLSPYTVYWTNGPNGSGAVVDNDSICFATAAGTYSFVVRDSRYPGCPQVYTNVAVTRNTTPVVTVNPVSVSVCYGSPITLTASGASTYNWLPALGLSSSTGSSVIASPPVTTTYTVNGTSNAGCTASANTTYTALPLPVIEAGPGDTICRGNNTQLQGSGAMMYSWSPATGLNNPNIANPIASPLTTTTYLLTASTAIGQIIYNGDFSLGNTGFSSNYIHSSNLMPEGRYYITTDPNLTHPNFQHCTDHTTGSGNMMVVNGSGVANQSVWCQTVTVTPNTYYAFSTWLQSVHPASPAVLQFSINGTLLGSPFHGISTTCVWQQFYELWYSGSNTSANICIVNQNTTLSGNDFALDDINFSPLCENIDSVTIVVSDIIPGIVAAHNTCNGSASGTATANPSGGIPPYTYSWSNGSHSQSIAGLTAGIYSLTITDAIFCTATANVTITEPSLLTASISASTNVSCFGGNNGSAGVTANGGTAPYAYSWSNGASGSNNNNLVAGNYSLTATDANGCTATANVTITEPTLLTAAISASTNVSCFGGNNGSASIAVVGGAAPYGYLWSNGMNTSYISNLAAGNYTLTITDYNGCTANLMLVISEPALLQAGISDTIPVKCFGGNDGRATAKGFGGTEPYAYNWSNGQTSSTATNLSAGLYYVTITDSNGCIATAHCTITQPDELIAQVGGATPALCNGSFDGSASIIVSGGVQPYTYLWDISGDTTASAYGLPAGNYIVTVQDSNGCVRFVNVMITQPSPVIVHAYGSTTVCQGNYATIGATVQGGTAPYIFHWDQGLGNSASHTLQINDSTIFHVYATDTNGCISEADFVIVNINAPLMAMSTAPSGICKGGQAGIQVNVSGGMAPYSFSWNQGLGNSVPPFVVSPDSTTTYIVSITDACNSTPATDTIEIKVYPLPVPDFSTDPVKGCAQVLTHFYNQGDTENNTYSWDFGDPNAGLQNHSQDASPEHHYTQVGVYTVTLTITNSFGCSAIFSYPHLVAVYDKPVASFQTDHLMMSITDPVVRCTDESYDAVSWLYDFDDPGSGLSNTSENPNPVHTFSDTGKHVITLWVTNDHGCTDSTSKEVIVNDYFTFYAANAFTPNGDGVNDFFVPEGTHLDWSTFEMMIYDRWGGLVFHSKNHEDPWDGNMGRSSQPCQQGVYTWTVTIKDKLGAPHAYTGNITLFR